MKTHTDFMFWLVFWYFLHRLSIYYIIKTLPVLYFSLLSYSLTGTCRVALKRSNEEGHLRLAPNLLGTGLSPTTLKYGISCISFLDALYEIDSCLF